MNNMKKPNLDSILNEMEELHKKIAEKHKEQYPTGVVPIREEYWDYYNKKIEEKIEIIYSKLNEVIQYINKK